MMFFISRFSEEKMFALLKGFVLGMTAYMLGTIMDFTISIESMREMLHNTPQLFADAIDRIQINLLVISPVIYALTDTFLLDKTTQSFDGFKGVGVLCVHHIGYFVAHKTMHQIPALRKFHEFHHQYETFIIPSVGNAVSSGEFLIAYVAPFILGAAIIRPNEITFMIPIGAISVFNNIIHCKELRYIKWSPFLVSPDQHLEHHEHRAKHFAAPILNIDYLIDNCTNVQNNEKED